MRPERNPAVIRDDLPNLYSNMAGSSNRPFSRLKKREQLIDLLRFKSGAVRRHIDSPIHDPNGHITFGEFIRYVGQVRTSPTPVVLDEMAVQTCF